MENKKVAVIVPIYNVAPYLAQCLNSILSQTHKNFIAILVNDGSTDENKSLEIAKEFVRKDERFILIDKQNGGQGSARNTGLAYLKNELVLAQDSKKDSHTQVGGGLCMYEIESNPYNAYALFYSAQVSAPPQVEYVMFLDSDDWLDQKCIESCLACANGVDFVCFDHRFFYDGVKQPNNPTPTPHPIYHKEQHLTQQEYLKIALETNNSLPWIATNVCINYQFMLDTNLAFLHFVKHEDGLFSLHLTAFARNVYILPKDLTFYRIRKDSTLNRGGTAKPSPFLNDIFLQMKNDTGKTLAYWGCSSYFLMFFEALALRKQTQDTNLQRFIDTYFLIPWASIASNIANYDIDPLKLQKQLLVLKPYLQQQKLRLFAKLAIFYPNLYANSLWLRKVYYFFNALERKFRQKRNNLKTKFSKSAK